jgi:hypothetical protein
MLDAPVVPMFLGAVATVAASPPFRSLTVGVQFILSYYTEYLAELSQISVRVGLSRSFSHFFSGAVGTWSLIYGLFRCNQVGTLILR